MNTTTHIIFPRRNIFNQKKRKGYALFNDRLFPSFPIVKGVSNETTEPLLTYTLINITFVNRSPTVVSCQSQCPVLPRSAPQVIIQNSSLESCRGTRIILVSYSKTPCFTRFFNTFIHYIYNFYIQFTSYIVFCSHKSLKQSTSSKAIFPYSNTSAFCVIIYSH